MRPAGQQGFAVRVATASDVAPVDELLARSYPRLLRPDYPPSIMVMALPIISRAQPGLVACGTYFVVEDSDGSIIGAGGWTRARPIRGERPTGNIRHVVTDDRQIRRGVGRSLMTQVIRSAALAGIVQLDCMSTRTAVPFYEAMGFTAIGPITVPLGPGIDFPAVSMRRAI
jgi:GNAT superfamily N-acetyltransferase